MDRFVTKRKREMEEKCENGDSVASQRLKSATVTVPSCDVSASSVDSFTSKPKIPQNVKADKVEYRYYSESYIKYRFLSTLCVVRLIHSA
jgi:hypothetical protein